MYDYARLFTSSSDARAVGLGPETLNAGYLPRPEEERPFTERHPEVLWIALIVVDLRAGHGGAEVFAQGRRLTFPGGIPSPLYLAGKRFDLCWLAGMDTPRYPF